MICALWDFWLLKLTVSSFFPETVCFSQDETLSLNDGNLIYRQKNTHGDSLVFTTLGTLH